MNRPQICPSKPHRNRWLQQLVATLLISSVVQEPTVVVAQVQNANGGIAAQQTIRNRAAYHYTDDFGHEFNRITQIIETERITGLIDPPGQLLGCGGEMLSDYSGFSVALYEPDPSDPTGAELGNLLSLTPTEVPDNPNNGVPGGLLPNIENANPFFLSNEEEGRYNFLLDTRRNQSDAGNTYLLVVNPPENSIYDERYIKIEILPSQDDADADSRTQVVRYVARSLDGMPITADGGLQMDKTVVLIPDAEGIDLQLMAMQFETALCQLNQIRITKSGDRAAAEPGDIVIYRLTIQNTADGPLREVTATDTLPRGFEFLADSVQGELNGESVEIETTQTGRTITLQADQRLLPNEVINIAYAAEVTPDAIRGSGENSAVVEAERVDNRLEVRDGPSIHRLRINPGIVSDCGTIIGRVFVDRNFDGEQHPGEPGVPNAVIFLDDGNRITTDAEGLFSVRCALPGYRTGAIDLTALPGYQLAPNQRFIERNSPSRLVHLAPGGMVRMNFGVIPVGEESRP